MESVKYYGTVMRIFLAHIFLLSLMLAGCGGGDQPPTTTGSSYDPPVTTGSWYKPPVFTKWQWQLTGPVNTTYNVDIYDIDLFDSSESLIQQLHAKAAKVICYFSGGTYEDWRPDANSFSAGDLGNAVAGWPGEYWLDIRSTKIHTIMKNRLDLAVQKNCDGVEPDNMDGYTNNPGLSISAADQLYFNRLIANEAHSRNLSVGLKNDLNQINDLVSYFDFAVNESCFEYSECAALTPFVDNGKAVLNAEYQQKYVDNGTARNTLCNESLNRQFSTLILPLDLDDRYRFSCL
jgi:hypothetical protein